MARRSDIEALTPGLRRYARGLTGAFDIADDLTQDAILSGLRSGGMGRGPALKRRLYAILTDFNRMRVAALADSDAYGEESRGVVTPFSRGVAGETAPAVDLSPLALLTLAEREAILLVAIEGFDYPDAADIIGVSRPALIARLARARGEGAPNADRNGGRRHLRVVS
ncbi:sigma factor-like helix-turn-helix DNA-binding protein [Terrarubrum flagellatum]|uniref:sigma factor-like helix-turn-helix DNA-binding protein n=1 Tax=Terrirubrum flagellatum TaxID=2895980 RepID=UPI00314528B2